jgi:hypothetical protein
MKSACWLSKNAGDEHEGLRSQGVTRIVTSLMNIMHRALSGWLASGSSLVAQKYMKIEK